MTTPPTAAPVRWTTLCDTPLAQASGSEHQRQPLMSCSRGIGIPTANAPVKAVLFSSVRHLLADFRYYEGAEPHCGGGNPVHPMLLTLVELSADSVCLSFPAANGAGAGGAFFPYEALVEGREWPAVVDPSHRERCDCEHSSKLSATGRCE